MPDITTLNGSLVLNTSPTALGTHLAVSRRDVALPANAALAEVSLYGSGTGNLQGVIALSTMGSGQANGPLEERLRVHSNGNVGIGTAAPVNKLDVMGDVAVQGKHALRGNDAWLRLNQEGAFANGVHTPGNLSSMGLNVGGVAGWAYPGSGNLCVAGKVVIGAPTASPMANPPGFSNLQMVSGAITPATGNAETAGVMFPKDPAGGAGDGAWIRYYPRAGESMTLEVGIHNDPDDHIALMPSGNVGVGTNAPVNKLDVNGDLAIRGKHALRGNDTWLRLNEDGAFAGGVHTPGNFFPNALNVGGAGSAGHPGNGNAWVTGAVGVGTTTPKRRLHVHDDTSGAAGAGSAEIHASGASAGFSFTDRVAGSLFDNGAAGERWVLYSQNKVARLWTPGVGDRLTLDKDANLEIHGDLRIQGGHTLYSRGRMHVNGEELLYLLNKSGVVVSKAWGGTGNLAVEGNLDCGGSLTKLDVADNFTATVRAADFLFGHSSRRGAPGRALVDMKDSAGKKTLRINYEGDWPGGCRYYVSMDRASSRTLKHGIQTFASETARQVLDQLQPVSYGLRTDTEPRSYLGFIAEDVPPEVGAPDRAAVNTDHVVAVLTRVLKDQQLEIAKLQDRLQRLERTSA